MTFFLKIPVFMSVDLSVSWHYGITLRRLREQLLLQNYKTQKHAVFFLKDTLFIEDDKS